MMTNTEWLLLQLIADFLVIWLCWEVYPHLCNLRHQMFSNERDEHEDVDRARG